MKKKSTKLIFGILSAISIMIIFPASVNASSYELRSKGSIIMQKENTNEITVKIYAEDIEYLKNEIEALKDEL